MVRDLTIRQTPTPQPLRRSTAPPPLNDQERTQTVPHQQTTRRRITWVAEEAQGSQGFLGPFGGPSTVEPQPTHIGHVGVETVVAPVVTNTVAPAMGLLMGPVAAAKAKNLVQPTFQGNWTDFAVKFPMYLKQLSAGTGQLPDETKLILLSQCLDAGGKM